MQSSVKKIDSGIIELTVELVKDELQGYVSSVEERIGQEVAIDGFRKGKAPKDLVKKHVGAGEVLQAALENALEDSLAKVIRERDLDVASSTNLAIKENTGDKLKYTVTLTVFPEVTLPDLAQIKVQEHPAEVQEHELKETLDVVRNMRATFSEKEDAVQEGDRVEADFKVMLDGKAIEGGESKNHPLIIGGKNFMPGFEDQLVGLKKGEEKSFSLVAPADYFQKDLAGKKLDFTVKVNLVQTVRLPDLDDAFAQGTGPFKNLDQLKHNIREGMLQEKVAKEKQRVHLEILDKIMGASQIETPAFLVKEQLDAMIDNFDSDLHAKGMELGMYLAHIGKTQDELRKDWQKNAEKQTKIVLILHAVVKANGLAVTELETDSAANQTVQDLVSRGQVDPASLNLKAIKESVADRLRNQKALEFLEKNCAA